MIRIEYNCRTRVCIALFGCASGLLLVFAERGRGEPKVPSADKATSSSKPSMLIEPSELARSLEDPKLRILDTRSKADYAKGHIPGARQLLLVVYGGRKRQ
jgi:hypothetical protein